MAFVTDIRAPHAGSSNVLLSLWDRAADAWARRRLYNKTLSELNSLTARELADLGIHRSMIQSIAYEGAYGK